jgi:hypothetical protein
VAENVITAWAASWTPRRCAPSPTAWRLNLDTVPEAEASAVALQAKLQESTS